MTLRSSTVVRRAARAVRGAARAELSRGRTAPGPTGHLRHRGTVSGAIIVLSGMDGAGKSTQIERLCRRLTAAGMRPQRVWSRGGYTPGMNWLKAGLRRAAGRSILPPPGRGARRDRTMARPFVRRLWLRLAILDLLLLYGVWLRVKRCMGHTVVCDRYLPDTALDFQINFPQEDLTRWPLWRLMAWCAPVPDCQFLLIIPVDESQRRSVLKNEPFPDAPEVLQMRYATYRSWAQDRRWHVLDGCRPEDDVAAEIEGAVFGTQVATAASH